VDPQSERGRWLRRWLPHAVSPLVLATFVLQAVGYAATAALVPHGDLGPLAVLVVGLPTPVLLSLAIFGLPSVLLAVALVGVLEVLLGVSLSSVGIGLVTGSDLPVLVVAYLLAVVFPAATNRLRSASAPGCAAE